MSIVVFPQAPFPLPVTPPGIEPNDPGDLICVTFNRAWRPYILGALTSLLAPQTYQGTIEEITLATRRAGNLISIFQQDACTMIEDIRVMGCELQIFSDGAWIPIGDFSTCGAQGVQGERGIQGEQGERGIQGEQGIPGAQGEKGDKGDKGADGTTFPLPESTGEDDQDSCNVAGFLAEGIIKKVVGLIIEAREGQKSRNETVIDIIESLMGVKLAEKLPVVGVLISAVSDAAKRFVNALFLSDLPSLQNALDDAALWSDIACAIYCAVTPDRGVTEENIQDVLDAVSGVIYDPNQALINEFRLFMETLGLVGLQAASQSGIYAVYDCSGCGCADVIEPRIITFDPVTYPYTTPPSIGLGVIQESGGDGGSRWYKSTIVSSPNDCTNQTTIFVDFTVDRPVEKITAKIYNNRLNVEWSVSDAQGNLIKADLIENLSGWTERTIIFDNELSVGDYRISVSNCWGVDLYVGIDSIRLWAPGE